MKLQENPPEENRLILEIEEGYSAYERLDVLITNRLPKISRSRVQKLIKDERILVDGKPSKASAQIPGGVIIDIIFPHPPRPAASAEDIPINIIFEDESLLVINKPAGMVVHPAVGHHSGTLVNALLHHFKDLPAIGDEATQRPGIVHRIDKDTSGLLVVAKTEYVMTKLGELFHEHDVDREYITIVWGNPPDRDTIDAPIARHPGDRKRYAVVEDGKHAVTHFEVIERFGFASLLRVKLETGRTHQIRVHMSSKGWPVFGDATYRGTMHGLSRLTSIQRDTARKALKVMTRQALHAKTLGFIHPVTKEKVHFSSELPDDFIELMPILREALE